MNVPFVCRGVWIRTSDLLNPIQESRQPNSLPQQEVAPASSTACTTACTTNAETGAGQTVEALATALLALPELDRGKLVALLLGQQPGQGEGKGGTA
jgi:hypothetical protein